MSIVRAVSGLALCFLLAGADCVVGQDGMQPPVSGRLASVEGIRPADVLSRVKVLRREIELVRGRLGESKPAPLGLRVEGAQPREVYFQALTLVRKSEQLSFERGRTLVAPLEQVRVEELAPFHVWQAVNRALEGIRAAKRELRVTQVVSETVSPEETTPTDVFNTVLEVNRELDLLLLSGFAPQSVYQQVTWSVHHAARLLSAFPNAIRIPEEPAYEKGKVPGQVHERLLACFEVVREIAKLLDVRVLEVRSEKLDPAAIVPNDVYNVASLIASELAYLHGRSRLGAVVPVHPPGPKVPSDVYQRAGLLETQLRQLAAKVRADPTKLLLASPGGP